MRKIIDAMAIASFVVSASVVSGGVYLYTQKDALMDRARERATEAIAEAVTGALGGGLTESLPEVPVPSSPAGSGLPIPF